MICKNCKQSVPDNATFCKYCGANLTKINSTQEESCDNSDNVDSNGFPLRCRCGHKLNYDDTVCPKCHRKLYVTVQRTNDLFITEPHIIYGSDKYIFLIIYIVCILLMFFKHGAYGFGAFIAITAGTIYCPNSTLLKVVFWATVVCGIIALFWFILPFLMCISIAYSCPG